MININKYADNTEYTSNSYRYANDLNNEISDIRKISLIQNGKIIKYLDKSDLHKIEYLQGASTQYIDTGFKHNQDTRFVCKINYSNVQAWSYPFGSYGNAKGTNTLFCAETNASNQLTTYYKTAHNFSIAATSNSGTHTYDLNKNVHKIDNTTYTYTKSNFTSIYNTYIFGCTGYTGGLTLNATVKKIYYFQIYDNGTLIRDYIPVRVGTVGYMLDRVSNLLYGNNGTGDFVLGSDI